jgi:hypothetical protein
MSRAGLQDALWSIFFCRLKDSAALVGSTDKVGEGGEPARGENFVQAFSITSKR